MAQWTDRLAWKKLVSGESCPVCLSGRPLDVIAEVENCWLTMSDPGSPALPGTCALFVRRHVVELHDLNDEEAIQFMAALRRVSALLHAVTGAVKLNLECHGNTIPHLHVHFFPRSRGDPFEQGPIIPGLQGSPDGQRRHAAIRRRLIEQFGA